MHGARPQGNEIKHTQQQGLSSAAVAKATCFHHAVLCPKLAPTYKASPTSIIFNNIHENTR